MVKIVHFHYNTDKNVNIGDEAHVLAIQETLQEQIRDVSIVNFPISFLCHYQLPQSLTGKHLPLFVHNAARRLRGVSYGELLREINYADLAIIGGGGVYMDHLLPFNIPLIHNITTPIVIFGAGYNRNFGSVDFNPHQLESIKELGQCARMQSVRDTNTKTFLEQQGITAELVGDPAMFLRRTSTQQLPNTSQLRIAVNIAAHGWKQQPRFEEILINSYAAVIRAVQVRHNAQVFYFVHHPGEYRVVAALKEKGIHFEKVVDANAKDTKAVYSQMDLSISMMLHSTILAFGENVPSVCIGYDDKNKSFMDLTNQTDRYMRVDEVSSESLLAKVEAAIDALDKSTSAVKARYNELKRIHDSFASRISQLVEEK